MAEFGTPRQHNVAEIPTPSQRRDLRLQEEYGRPIRTTEHEGVCAEEGCGTKLSRYNPDDKCALHRDARHVINRGEPARKGA